MYLVANLGVRRNVFMPFFWLVTAFVASAIESLWLRSLQSLELQ